MSKRRRVTSGLVFLSLIALVVALALMVDRPGGRTRVTAAASSVPLSIGGITADQLASRGIYLGSPGTLPADVPSVGAPIVPTTSGPVAPTSPPQPSPEQVAVVGDPANGTASVSASTAVTVALKNIGGFVGPVTAGNPILVQFDNVYASVVATAWAIPVTGQVELSAGPAAPSGNGGAVAPYKTTALVFIDATTGRFISEEGFSG